MMFGIFVIAAFSVAVCSAGVQRNSINVVSEQQAQDSGHYEEIASGGYGNEYEAVDEGKESSGAELTSLAHTSAVQAKNAVRSQHTAGSQAAFGIKSTLANAAQGAAQTAQAALVGKQAIVYGLKRQLGQAESQLQAEIAQYHQTQHAAEVAQQAAQQAQSQASTLSAALAATQTVDEGKESSGAELTSLAHTSAVQAKNAVRSQHTAGSQAAFGIKSTLANAAQGAAQTAQAALVGKQAIVYGLKRQLGQAESQLQAEIAQYHQTQHAAEVAQQAAQQAQSQASTLSAALAATQSGGQLSEKAAAEASKVAASQQSMVSEAKQRISALIHQLQNAVGELGQTESAYFKAAQSAQTAQSNAAAAGAAVVAASAKSEASSGESHYLSEQGHYSSDQSQYSSEQSQYSSGHSQYHH